MALGSSHASQKRDRSIASLLTSPLRPTPVTGGAAVAMNQGTTNQGELYLHSDPIVQFYVRLARLMGAMTMAREGLDSIKDAAEKVTEVCLHLPLWIA
jgi:hypothetical protein